MRYIIRKFVIKSFQKLRKGDWIMVRLKKDSVSPKPPTSEIIIKLQTKELNAPHGNKIKLEPLLENMGGILVRAPQELTEKMGIPFMITHAEVKIFDDDGYKKAVAERHILGTAIGNGGGKFFPEEQDIFINADAGLRNETGSACSILGLTPEEDLATYLKLFELMVEINLIGYFYHELTHLNHYLYDSKLFESGKAWNRRKKREQKGEIKKQGYFRDLVDTFAVSRDLALVEGIASLVEHRILGDTLHKVSEGRFNYKNTTLNVQERDLSLLEKMHSLLCDPHSLGLWFVRTVGNLVEENPIKLLIDNPPRTIRELLEPELYARKIGQNQGV